jgi:hypothetical protein
MNLDEVRTAVEQRLIKEATTFIGTPSDPVERLRRALIVLRLIDEHTNKENE